MTLMKFCMNCGTQLPDAAKFCLACGAKQDFTPDAPVDAPISTPVEAGNLFSPVEEVVAPPKPRVKKPMKPRAWMPILCNSLIMVIALLFIIFSFLPVIQFDIDAIVPQNLVGDKVDYQFKISTTDTFVYLFDSFKDLDQEDLLDSRLYEKLQDLAEEMQDWDAESFDELSNREKRDFNAYINMMLRLQFQSEDTRTSTYLILSSVVGLIYILVCIAFFVLATLNLLACLNVVKSGKNALYNWAMRLLCLTPMLLLGLYYVMYFLFSVGSSSSGVSMSGGSLTTFILSMVVIAVLATLRLIFAKGASSSIRILPIVLNSVVAILVLCFTFLPVLSTSLRATFSGSSTTKEATIQIDSNFFSSFELADSEIEALDSVKAMTREEKEAYFASLISAFSR